MINWKPEIVFFALTPTQAEDAWAVSKCLRRRILLMPLSESVTKRIPRAFLSDRLRAVTPLSRWLVPVQRERFFLLGLTLITRLTRSRPFPVFVFGDDVNALEHILIQFVRRRGAHSVLIQDGFLDQRDQQWVVAGSRLSTRVILWLLTKKGGLGLPFKMVYGAGGCDVIAAYGYQARDVLVQRGVPPETISITGSPRFDDLFSAVPSPRHASTTERVILVLGVVFSAHGWSESEHDERWLRSLHALSLQKPEWRIVLRPHPTESMELYEEKLSRLGETALVLDRSTPIQEVLRASHAVVVNFPSTVVLEAVILGIPVVFLDLHLEIQRNDYTSESGVLTLCDPESLAQVLDQVTDASWQQDQRPQDREAFLHRYLGSVDGQSAQRIADLIDSLYNDRDGS